MSVKRGCAHSVPGFKHGNFVDVIEGSDWPD